MISSEKLRLRMLREAVGATTGEIVAACNISFPSASPTTNKDWSDMESDKIDVKPSGQAMGVLLEITLNADTMKKEFVERLEKWDGSKHQRPSNEPVFVWYENFNEFKLFDEPVINPYGIMDYLTYKMAVKVVVAQYCATPIRFNKKSYRSFIGKYSCGDSYENRQRWVQNVLMKDIWAQEELENNRGNSSEEVKE